MLKTKRDLNRPAGRARFLILWTLGMLLAQIIAALMGAILFSLLFFTTNDRTNLYMVVLSLVLPVRAFIQVQVVERQLKKSMRGWNLYSITGFVTSLVMCFILFTPFQGSRPWNIIQRTFRIDDLIGLPLIIFLTLLPTLAFQTFWLRRHVKQAWLWLLVGVVLMLMFTGQQLVNPSLKRSSESASEVMYLIVMLIEWIVPGLAMYHMMKQPKETIKAKHEVSEGEALA